MARSLKYCVDSFLPPIPQLPPSWLHAASDDSPVWRLATALASVGLRRRVTPLAAGRRPRWAEHRDPAVGWTNGDLVRSLHRMLLRRELTQVDPPPVSKLGVSTADLAWWLDHPEADGTIEELALGLALVDTDGVIGRDPSTSAWLPPTFLLLHLCVADRTMSDSTLPRTPGLLQRACSGDAAGATRLALRRLKGAGVPLRLHERPRTARPWAALPHPPDHTRRLAAALAFPLSRAARKSVRDALFTETDTRSGADTNHSPNEVDQ